MAATWTVSGATVTGDERRIWGTFTTAAGDNSLTLAPATHGLNNVRTYNVSLDAGGVGTQTPKVANSAGTLTITFDDTLGYSGTWWVSGK